MLAEGFHSVADSGNQLFLLRGTRASRFRPSVRFPFGRGMEIYFWSFLVAVVLFVGGGVVAFMEGLNRLRHPHPDEGGLAFNLVVLGIAAFFEIVVAFRVALKEFNRRRGTRGLVRTVRESQGPHPAGGAVRGFGGGARPGWWPPPACSWPTGPGSPTGTPWPPWSSACCWRPLPSSWRSRPRACSWASRRGGRCGPPSGRRPWPSRRWRRIDRLLTMHLGPEEILVNMDLVVDRRSQRGRRGGGGAAGGGGDPPPGARGHPGVHRIGPRGAEPRPAGGSRGPVVRRCGCGRGRGGTMPQSRPEPSTTGTGAPSRKVARPATTSRESSARAKMGASMRLPSGAAGSAASRVVAADHAHQAALLGDGDDRRVGEAQGLAGGHLHPHGGRVLHVLEAAARGAAHHHRPGGGAAAQLAARPGELPLPPGAAGGAEHQQQTRWARPGRRPRGWPPAAPAARRWGPGRRPAPGPPRPPGRSRRRRRPPPGRRGRRARRPGAGPRGRRAGSAALRRRRRPRCRTWAGSKP